MSECQCCVVPNIVNHQVMLGHGFTAFTDSLCFGGKLYIVGQRRRRRRMSECVDVVLVAPSLGVTTDWSGQAPSAPAVVSQSVRACWTHLCCGRSEWWGRSTGGETGAAAWCPTVPLWWCGDIVTVITLSVTPTARDPYQYLS